MSFPFLLFFLPYPFSVELRSPEGLNNGGFRNSAVCLSALCGAAGGVERELKAPMFQRFFFLRVARLVPPSLCSPLLHALLLRCTHVSLSFASFAAIRT